MHENRKKSDCKCRYLRSSVICIQLLFNLNKNKFLGLSVQRLDQNKIDNNPDNFKIFEIEKRKEKKNGKFNQLKCEDLKKYSPCEEQELLNVSNINIPDIKSLDSNSNITKPYRGGFRDPVVRLRTTEL